MKMEKIIKTLLGDVKGVLSVKQVQLLFSKLLGIPQEDIGEDHEAVVAFAGLEAEVAVETLFSGTTKAQVDEYIVVPIPSVG